jgi:presenilin-like A22 family membrane protease
VKKPWIITGLFYLAIAEGIWIFASAFYDFPFSLAFTASLLIFLFWFRNVLIHNIAIIIAIASISVIFGAQLSPHAVIFILLVLAVYDYWAVYRTRHMVEMFQGMAKQKVHFALIVPQRAKELYKKLKNVSVSKEFMFLGTGDIALPLILSISAITMGLRVSIWTSIGAIVGYILLFFIFTNQKEPQPMPGLPPIILGALIGYGIGILM